MERILSSEEKIRRAEEIYARRRNQNVKNMSARVKVSEDKDIKLFKKMIKQILVCLILYFVFYAINNSNLIFSEDTLNKTREILSYDINIENLYNQAVKIIKPEEQQEIVPPEEDKKEDTENIIQNNAEQMQIPENTQTGMDEPIAQKTQEEIDIEEVKSHELIKPVQGIVSSQYGEREQTSEIVTPKHYGVDIAANEGTKIIAAMDGTVTTSGYSEDFGNHLKITNNDIVIIYAHCKTLYSKEGESIKKGQEIAEVGSTGKATGPHLHFEIRKSDRHVNPNSVVQL